MKQTNPKQAADKKEYQAASIGKVAFESLQADQEGSVIGISSRGIFLQTTNKWLKFLSYEPYRGPLTINLPLGEGSTLPINRGMSVLCSSKKIVFPEADVLVSIQNSEVWQPQPPPAPPLARAELQARLISLAKRILEDENAPGLAPLLPRLLNISDQPDALHHDQLPIYANILDLHQEMKSAPGLPASASAMRVLGSGAGLTPSGDDFVMGLLLAFNRWKDDTFDRPDLERFNRQIVRAAYQSTTSLSANLIECAALGLGDERLIETLDWLVGGSDQEPAGSDHLLSWGSSSGMDVFVGYVVALSM